MPAKKKKDALNGSLGDKFNSKILLWGEPGSGKTTFVGSYTKGPVHIYLSDPQGASVLRRNSNEITVDEFTDESHGRGKTYPAFYKQLQKDEKSGFFEDMKEKEGIVVVDSYTSMENYLVEYVARSVLGKKESEGGAFAINRQDWPTISSYVLAFFKAIVSLPCAVVVICHSKSIQDEEQRTFFRPTILGQQAEQAPRWFSEYMRTSLKGDSLHVTCRGNPRFPAASRLFLPDDKVRELKGPTMDTLYKAFHGEAVDCKTL